MQLSEGGFSKVSKVSKFWKYIRMDTTDFGAHPDLRGERARLHSVAQHFVGVLNATPDEIQIEFWLRSDRAPHFESGLD